MVAVVHEVIGMARSIHHSFMTLPNHRLLESPGLSERPTIRSRALYIVLQSASYPVQ